MTQCHERGAAGILEVKEKGIDRLNGVAMPEPTCF